MSNLKFSIITPTFNEEKDIRGTLEAFLGFSYPNKEIIIVDDSTDRTPEIVKEYENRGVRLIRGNREGCCGAVNLGFEKSTGDIVIYADADARPPQNFLEKLVEKYENGADWVLPDSHVPNTEKLWSRFVGALHIAEHEGRSDMYYAEAFSVRRELAFKMGLFGPNYPARFCRDWILGKKLTEAGYKKVYDPTLIVEHPQPDNFWEFWHTRKARGKFGPLVQYYMQNKSLPYLFLKLIAKDGVFVLRFLLIFPAVARVYKITKKSERGMRDFMPFLMAYFIQEWSRVVGEWAGFKELITKQHPISWKAWD